MEINIIETLVLTLVFSIPSGILVYAIWSTHFKEDEKIDTNPWIEWLDKWLDKYGKHRGEAITAHKYVPEEKPGKIIPSDWPVSENDLKYQKAIKEGLIYLYCHVCGNKLYWYESKEVIDGYHILRCESCKQEYKREKKPIIEIK